MERVSSKGVGPLPPFRQRLAFPDVGYPFLKDAFSKELAHTFRDHLLESPPWSLTRPQEETSFTVRAKGQGRHPLSHT